MSASLAPRRRPRSRKSPKFRDSAMKLTFMGTAGARFMVAKQLAASGGIYLEEGDTRLSLDPGPGAIVQYAKRKVDPSRLQGLADQHAAEVMVIHVVLLERRPGLPHLCLDDAEAIISQARPRLAVLTHFGMTMWRARPWELAARLAEKTGVEVKAARDGMTL